MTALILILGTIYTGIQSARLITQPNRNRQE